MIERRSHAWRYNVAVAPVVILIRIPLLLPLWALAAVGRKADMAGELIGHKLPGFKR